MARVTYVKRAQTRYKMVPKLDDAGNPVIVPVLRKDGTPKKTKAGREVVRRVTVADRSQPLPLLRCDSCGKDIEVGTPYKYVEPKSGPYGGGFRSRHQSCPSWQIWELSNSWSARVAQVQAGFSLDDVDSADAVRDALQTLAEEVRSLSEESRETAENVREGFGHDTFVSEEADQRADDLEFWADEIESVEVPEQDEYPCTDCNGEGTKDCDICSGSGSKNEENCVECGGSGQTECETCNAEEGYVDMEAWMEAVQEAASVADNSPI